MADQLLRLTLEIEPDTSPIRGWLCQPPGAARRFDSWLELVAALDQLIAGQAAQPQ